MEKTFNKHTPIPVPKSFSCSEELFAVEPVIAAPAEFLHCAEVLAGYIKRIFRLEFSVTEGTVERGICLSTDMSYAKEEYSVHADGGLVSVFASDTAGFSHGCSTILQMAEAVAGELQIYVHDIEDRPDIEWRGLMVDTARAWYSLDELQAYVDICYYYRLSVVHFHFADGISYKIPSAAFPKLDIGRTYPKEQIDLLRKYLIDRGLMIVPEIEMPGHCEMLGAFHPEVFGSSHVNTVCFEHEKEVFRGLDTLIGEVCELFPEAPYIHVGCDEVRHDFWRDCPHCQNFMKKMNFDSTGQLYSYMVDRCTRMVLAKGRTPIVWEGFPKEGAENLSRDIIVMVFQSTFQNAIDLTNAGFKVINTSWQPLYIVPSRPKYWNPDEVYKWKYNKWLYETAVDDSEQMIVEKEGAVKGAQICLWEGCHYDTDGSIVEENVAVMAERLWNESYAADYETFASQKSKVSRRLLGMIRDSLDALKTAE